MKCDLGALLMVGAMCNLPEYMQHYFFLHSFNFLIIPGKTKQKARSARKALNTDYLEDANIQVHEYMTQQELGRIFQVEHHDEGNEIEKKHFNVKLCRSNREFYV